MRLQYGPSRVSGSIARWWESTYMAGMKPFPAKVFRILTRAENQVRLTLSRWASGILRSLAHL